MARTTGPKKTPGRPRNASSAPKPNRKPRVDAATRAELDYAKQALQTSYGSGQVSASMKAVTDWYANLPVKQRQAELLKLAATIKGRDLSAWSGDPGQIAMFGEISPGARLAYATLDPRRNRPGGLAGTPEAEEAQGTGKTLFTTGVSGATGAFIKEAGQSKYAAGEAEEGKQTKKRKKAQKKKLVKRVVKKTDVKGKTIRKALRSPGITASDKKVYRKVAKQASPKLSNRLRQRDRRGK